MKIRLYPGDGISAAAEGDQNDQRVLRARSDHARALQAAYVLEVRDIVPGDPAEHTSFGPTA